MEKEFAFDIVQEYLNTRRLIESARAYVYRLQYDLMEGYEYCWYIPYKIDVLDGSEMHFAGGGPYLVDKENGKIYSTGSAPVDWIKEFELMKFGSGSRWNWIELKNHFLEVEFKKWPKRTLFTKTVEVPYNEVNDFIKEELSKYENWSRIGYKVYIKQIKCTEFQSTFLIGYPEKEMSNDMLLPMDFEEVLSLSLGCDFNKYRQFTDALPNVKEWLLLNKAYKSTSQFWLESEWSDDEQLKFRIVLKIVEK